MTKVKHFQSGFISLKSLVLVVVVLTIIGCTGYLVWHHRHTISTNLNHPAATTINASKSKSAPMQGILSEGIYSDHGGFTIPASPWDQAFSGIVVHAHWADLQPTANGPIASNNLIDQAITALQSYNTSHSHQLNLKIRVFAGIYAPTWAKQLNGFSPVPILRGQYKDQTIGPFWTAAYMSAYQDLQSKLAAKYDSNPLLHDITVSACMTVFAEPLDWGGFDNYGPLFAQGYSDTARINCFNNQVDAHTAWKQTHSSLSFNPFQAVILHGTTYQHGAADISVTDAVIKHCRSALGPLCVLENNSLRQSFIGGTIPLDQMYQSFKQAGPDITIQTATASNVGNLDQVIRYAASFGANAVEIPSQYASLISLNQLIADNQLLLHNPIR